MRSRPLLLSFLAASFLTMHSESFAAADPVLTEKSLETFTLDFDGLTLALPIELKPRVMAQAQDNKILKSLEIGNVDFSYNRLDPKTKEARLINGWIEGEAFKSVCSDQKELDSIRKLLVSNSQDQDTIKIQHVVNDKFKGYIVNWSQYSRGKLSGVALDLIDSQKSVCYTFSLAVQDVDGFSGKEIRDAVSPLTDPIRKSFTSYAHADE